MERYNDNIAIKRYNCIDNIRGITIISMIVYHAMWDLVYIFDRDIAWYHGEAAYIWQQSICWTFILLSGFCWSMGKKPLSRGLIVFAAGAVITLVTLMMPHNEHIIFGILTCIGSCMMIMCLADRIFSKIPEEVGVLSSIFIFLITKNTSNGYLGFGNLELVHITDKVYDNMVTAYLGFPKAGFYSADYFPLIPWIFLFFTGYFIYGFMKKHDLLMHFAGRSTPLCFIGRHSLLIYMIHQPFIFLVLQTL